MYRLYKDLGNEKCCALQIQLIPDEDLVPNPPVLGLVDVGPTFFQPNFLGRNIVDVGLDPFVTCVGGVDKVERAVSVGGVIPHGDPGFRLAAIVRSVGLPPPVT